MGDIEIVRIQAFEQFQNINNSMCLFESVMFNLDRYFDIWSKTFDENTVYRYK